MLKARAWSSTTNSVLDAKEKELEDDLLTAPRARSSTKQRHLPAQFYSPFALVESKFVPFSEGTICQRRERLEIRHESACLPLTSISGVTVADLALIVAFELNLVGPVNGESTGLSSGAGTIVYG
jgi:hypothetical protein